MKARHKFCFSSLVFAHGTKPQYVTPNYSNLWRMYMLQAACEIDIAAAAVRNENWGAENKIGHCILSAPPQHFDHPPPPKLVAVSLLVSNLLTALL